MKYVALLRAINVGGKNLMKMAEVRACLEERDFACVSTYIQSGNVLFESDVADAAALTSTIEKAFSETFGQQVPVFLRSYRQMKKIVADAPREWKNGDHLRRNVAFLLKPLTASKAGAAIAVNPDVDSLEASDGVLYMTTVIARAAQSRFNKVVGQAIYKDITVRSYTTCQKILALMGRDSS